MRLVNLFFDLDGTLVDTLPGIEYSSRVAVSAVFPGREFPGLGRIGPPISEIFRRMFPDSTADTLDALQGQFRASYDSEGWKKSVAYSGVAATLCELKRRDVRCFVVTNKPALATEKILRYIDLWSYFVQVVSPDSRPERFASKADAIAFLLSQHSLRCDESAFVGDSQDDADAARACNLPFIAVSYGYGAVADSVPESARDYVVLDEFAGIETLL